MFSLIVSYQLYGHDKVHKITVDDCEIGQEVTILEIIAEWHQYPENTEIHIVDIRPIGRVS